MGKEDDVAVPQSKKKFGYRPSGLTVVESDLPEAPKRMREWLVGSVQYRDGERDVMQRRGCLEFLRLENESCDSMRLGDAFLRGNKSETSPADSGQVFFGGIDGPKEQWISCELLSRKKVHARFSHFEVRGENPVSPADPYDQATSLRQLTKC